MIILAFDVSLARTGVAVLEDGRLTAHDVIATSDKEPRCNRLLIIYDDSYGALGYWDPDIIAIETSTGFQKQSHDSRASIEALGQARGALLVAVAEYTKRFEVHKPQIIEKDPGDVREIVCANRRASKVQVQENLRQRGFTLPTMANGKVDPDVADALAVAVCVEAEERLLAMKEAR